LGILGIPKGALLDPLLNLSMFKSLNRYLCKYSFLLLAALGCLAPLSSEASTLGLTRAQNNLGLVGYWTFDGKDIPGLALDRSGQGNNGNLVNMSTSSSRVAGKLGQALNFDGVDDSVNIPYNANLRPTTAVTYAFWIKKGPVQNNLAPRILFSANNYHNIFINGQTSKSLAIRLDRTGSVGTTQTIGTVTDNIWTHAAVTYDNSNIVTYINGVLTNTYATSTDLVTDTSAEKIGGEPSRYNNSAIDDVRIYNRALSATEVTQLYNMGSAKYDVSPTKTLASGLVGYWTFDGKDIPNGRANDISGNSNNGTLKNISTTTFYKAGKIGQGFNFDGVNDYVDAGDINTIDTATALSGCAWLKHKTIDTDDVILSKNSSGNDGFVFFRDEVIAGGTHDVYTIFVADSADTDTATLSGTQNSSPLNKWTHVCFTFKTSSATGLRLYVNGVEDAGSPASTVNIGAIDAGTNVLSIGDRLDATDPFDGQIDDVRIYNRALSATEVAQLYNMGTAKYDVSPTKTLASGLVGYWTFDGKDIPGLALDLSGQGNKGNLVNISTSTSRVPGKIGQALNFDGINDLVSLPSAVKIGAGGSSSVSAWFKTTMTTRGAIYAEGSTADGNPFFIIDHNNVNCTVGNIRFGTRNNTGTGLDTLCTTGLSINNGKWHQVVGTFNGTTKTIYIDGVSKVTSTPTIGPQTTNSFQIGALQSGSATQSLLFSGSIDDVRVYNRALSSTEVTQLYNLGR